MISAGLEFDQNVKWSCECQIQHTGGRRSTWPSSFILCATTSANLLLCADTSGSTISVFSSIWLWIDLRSVHWSNLSEITGWVSVEGLTLMETELLKLCTSTAPQHETITHVQNCKQSQNLYSMCSYVCCMGFFFFFFLCFFFGSRKSLAALQRMIWDLPKQ